MATITENTLYLENGYLNMPEIIKAGYTFTILVTGRGTGKTYGTLDYMRRNNIKFIYMRRTDTQVQAIANNEMNIFNWINADNDTHIFPFTVTKGTYGYYNTELDPETGKYNKVGESIGLLAALSTLSNKRGFSGADIECMILDEFCPEPHERALKNESSCIFNCYETINRNRELQGRKPLQLIMLANSNSLASETLINFNLIPIITRLKKSGKQIYKNDDKSMLVICPHTSPISKQKKDTALYKLIAGTEYDKMATENEFTDISFSRIKSRPLQEYKPLVSVGDITIYKHKSRSEIYVSKHRAGACPVFGVTTDELKRLKRLYSAMVQYYIDDKIIYEDEEAQVLFVKFVIS